MSMELLASHSPNTNSNSKGGCYCCSLVKDSFRFLIFSKRFDEAWNPAVFFTCEANVVAFKSNPKLIYFTAIFLLADFDELNEVCNCDAIVFLLEICFWVSNFIPYSSLDR